MFIRTLYNKYGVLALRLMIVLPSFAIILTVFQHEGLNPILLSTLKSIKFALVINPFFVILKGHV